LREETVSQLTISFVPCGTVSMATLLTQAGLFRNRVFCFYC